MSITVGTYNLMKPNLIADRHNNAWELRKPDLLKNISSAKTDVLCVQELSEHDEPWMKAEANKLGYDFHYACCKKDSGIGVLFTKDKFNLVNVRRGIFEGLANGKKLSRAFVQLDLEDNTTKKVSRVASMHLYGGTSRGNPLGRQQIESFRSQIEENDQNISQIILAGDFNSDVKEEFKLNLEGPCRFMLRPNSISAYTYNTVPAGGNGPLIRTTNRSQRHIDWVFTGIKNANGANLIADMEMVPQADQIRNASDHLLHAVCIKETTISADIVNRVESAAAPVLKSEEPQKKSSHLRPRSPALRYRPMRYSSMRHKMTFGIHWPLFMAFFKRR